MKGDITSSFSKGGKTVQRTLNADKKFTRPDGSELVLPGRYGVRSCGITGLEKRLRR